MTADEITVASKRCPTCKETKAVSAFSRDSKKKDGLRSQCKECEREGQRVYRAANSEKLNEKNRVYRAANSEKLNEKSRVYRAANSEKLNEKSRVYRAANSEKVRERDRVYRAANPEKARERDRVYREANPEKLNEKSRVYRAANPEKLNEKSRVYRAANSEKLNEKKRVYYAANSEKLNEKSRVYRAANSEKVNEKNRVYRAANSEKVREYNRVWQVANPEKVRVNGQRRRARKANLPNTLTTAEWQYAIDYFHGYCAVCGRPPKNLFKTRRVNIDHWIPLSKGGGTTADNIVPLCSGEDGCNNRKGNKDPEVWLALKFGKRKARVILQRINAYFELVKAKDKEVA